MNISNHHCPWSPVFQPFSYFLRYSAPNFSNLFPYKHPHKFLLLQFPPLRETLITQNISLYPYTNISNQTPPLKPCIPALLSFPTPFCAKLFKSFLYKLPHKFLPLQVPPLQMVTFANFHFCEKLWLHKIYLYTHIWIYPIITAPEAPYSSLFLIFYAILRQTFLTFSHTNFLTNFYLCKFHHCKWLPSQTSTFARNPDCIKYIYIHIYAYTKSITPPIAPYPSLSLISHAILRQTFLFFSPSFTKRKAPPIISEMPHCFH